MPRIGPGSCDIVIFHNKHGDTYFPDTPEAYLFVLADRLDDNFYDGREQAEAQEIVNSKDAKAAHAFLYKRMVDGHEYEDFTQEDFAFRTS